MQNFQEKNEPPETSMNNEDNVVVIEVKNNLFEKIFAL